MSDFINTIDLLGDDVVLGSRIDGTITEFKDNVITTLGEYAFNHCKSLTMVDLPNLIEIGNSSFSRCSSLKALILRSSTLIPLSSVYIFYESSLTNNGTCYVYVPRALKEQYVSATNWSSFANQFRALEDYTVDGTTTGELDETKI